MAVLLLRLAGPMQSWDAAPQVGVQISREPSKCGVISLLCAALGTDVTSPRAIEPLAQLRMGVRVDREGVLARDFLASSSLDLIGAGSPQGAAADPVAAALGEDHGHCLADASFLVALEGREEALLAKCHRALAKPRSPLYLGRAGYLPGEPVRLDDGLREGGLDDALMQYEWRPRPRESLPPWGLRFVVETEAEEGEWRLDQPLCLAPGQIRLGRRRVRTSWGAPERSASGEGGGRGWLVSAEELPTLLRDTRAGQRRV